MNITKLSEEDKLIINIEGRPDTAAAPQPENKLSSSIEDAMIYILRKRGAIKCRSLN